MTRVERLVAAGYSAQELAAALVQTLAAANKDDPADRHYAAALGYAEAIADLLPTPTGGASPS